MIRALWRSAILLAALSGAASNGHANGAEILDEAVLRFEAADLSGRKWTHQDFQGRVVLIDFWATWCAPCLEEIPFLKSAFDRFRQRGFLIVGVSLDASSRRDLVAWLRRNRIRWPQIRALGGYEDRLVRLFQIRAIPFSLLLDREGRVVAVNLRGDRLLERIERLIPE